MNTASKRANPAARKSQKRKYVLLHIGKTGGTSLGALIRDLKSEHTDLPIAKLRHAWKLQRAAVKRPNAQIGFVVRDPAERFVSGFNSRLRSGRPDHEHVWKVEEAIVYAYFPTANDLAEALCSEDQRLRSAAEFAMQHIPHFRRGYQHHLGSVDVLESLKDRIYCVCDLKDLNDRLYDFFAPLGLDESIVRSQFRHMHKGHKDSPLSTLALDNLRKYWATEYEIYEYCKAELFNKRTT